MATVGIHLLNLVAASFRAAGERTRAAARGARGTSVGLRDEAFTV